MDSLRAYAYRSPQGGAYIGGLLESNGFGEVDIAPIFPQRHRSAHMQGMEAVQAAGTPQALKAYPDPADGQAMITFPAEHRLRNLVLSDASGRVVLRTLLASPGLFVLNTAALASGVYQAMIEGNNCQGRILVKH